MADLILIFVFVFYFTHLSLRENNQRYDTNDLYKPRISLRRRTTFDNNDDKLQQSSQLHTHMKSSASAKPVSSHGASFGTMTSSICAPSGTPLQGSREAKANNNIK